MTESGQVHAISSRAWIEVLHAEVGARLGAAGIPCLHIKGPTVATWLYAPGERPWGDVDILLPPSRMDDALEVLLAEQFSYRDPGLRWWTSEDHAITLVFDPDGHAERHVAAEVDMHHRFLGMDGDPERVFAELWRRREPYQLAQLDVWFPDVTTRSLIAVLNAARDPEGLKAPTDLRRLLGVASDADWIRVIALARRVGALEALRAGLELDPAGREVVARTSLAQVSVSAAVRLRAEGSSRTAVRIQELRTFGPWKKVKMLAGWVVPSPAVIRMREPSAAGSVRRMARAYVNRYRQGARELRDSVLEMRRPHVATESPVPPSTPTLPDPTPPPAAAAALSPTSGSPDLELSVSSLTRDDGYVALVSGGLLTGSLRERGWSSLTDEPAALDPDHLEIRSGSPAPDPPYEARLLVVPEYDPDAGRPAVEALAAGEVAGLVIAGGTPPVLARLARRVPAYRLRYADAGRAADEVTRLCRAGASVAAADVVGRRQVPQSGFHRPSHVGAAFEDDQVVLLDLRDGQRHVLSPSASAIWESLMSTGSVAGVVAELEDAFPDAVGLADDTARFVESLEAQGLVERG